MGTRASIPGDFEDILRKRAFGYVATIGANGEPHCQPVWFRWDGDRLEFSTIKQRQKYKNLVRDPRISVSIADADDPYRNLELRGRAEIEEDPTGTLIDELSVLYLGEHFVEADPSVDRVIVRVAPLHVTTYS